MANYAAIGTCRLCGQGRLIIARENATGVLYVLCEECESEWAGPDASQDIDVATHGSRGQSTLLQREELENHPWKVALW